MTPPDLGRSLSHRLRNRAAELAVDPARLRRHLVFQRVLARLAPSGQWVLKGGFSLEVRLALAGRATMDLDMVLAEAAASALDLQDLLDEALASDLDDDFTFSIALPRALPARDMGTPGWRVKVQASVAGQRFEQITLDVVIAPDEIVGAVQQIVVEPVIAGAGFEAATVPAVDIAQHSAEKLHAYCRVYANDQPSSRVKDLVDLVLMIEAGLLPPDAWAARCSHVFHVRDGSLPPAGLPAPPESWRAPYEQTADDLGISAASLTDAYDLVAGHYRMAAASTIKERAIDGSRDE